MSETHDPDRSLGFLLRDVSRLMRREFTRRVQPLGLTQAEWQALAHLSRQQGVNQATLAETMEVQPITLARQLDRLAAAGLVERRPDPADRRAFLLFLTPRAKPILEQMWPLAADVRDAAMAGLPPAAHPQMVEWLRAMRCNLLAAEMRTARIATPQSETEDHAETVG